MHRTTGALAAAPAPLLAEPEVPVGSNARGVPEAQGSLFDQRPASKIIPFASIAAARIEPPPPPQPAPAPKPVVRVQVRRQAPSAPKPDEQQPALDFLPPAPPAPRTLKTKVEAVIYCDAPVATSTHRLVAAALDGSMVLIACGVFLLTFHLGGGEFVLNRPTMLVFGAAFTTLMLFYGLLWALANTETPGMRWTYLRLTSFDGEPPSGAQRALRFAGTCLSFCSGGLGILWALVDEENLTWQDHISKTFLTFRAETNFVRRR